MKTDFKLDFFYYQEQFALDSEDPKVWELYPDREKFKDFLATKPLEDIIELLIYVYKEKYAQTSFWVGISNREIKLNSPYPSHLNEEVDYYLDSEEINRDDMAYFICKMEDNEEEGCYYLEYMEFAFKETQNRNTFKQAVQRGLKGKQFELEETTETTVFTVLDSPIASIELSDKKIKMVINPEKRVAYYGLG